MSLELDLLIITKDNKNAKISFLFSERFILILGKNTFSKT